MDSFSKACTEEAPISEVAIRIGVCCFLLSSFILFNVPERNQGQMLALHGNISEPIVKHF